MDLNHVRVNVTDLDRAVAWYEQLLGVPAEGHWPPDAPNYAHFRTGGATFGVMVAEPVPGGGRYNFTVDDVDRLWATLAENADVVEDLFDTPYGTRKFTIRDPDGNELGFVRAED